MARYEIGVLEIMEIFDPTLFCAGGHAGVEGIQMLRRVLLVRQLRLLCGRLLWVTVQFGF